MWISHKLVAFIPPYLHQSYEILIFHVEIPRNPTKSHHFSHFSGSSPHVFSCFFWGRISPQVGARWRAPSPSPPWAWFRRSSAQKPCERWWSRCSRDPSQRSWTICVWDWRMIEIYEVIYIYIYDIDINKDHWIYIYIDIYTNIHTYIHIALYIYIYIHIYIYRYIVNVQHHSCRPGSTRPCARGTNRVQQYREAERTQTTKGGGDNIHTTAHCCLESFRAYIYNTYMWQIQITNTNTIYIYIYSYLLCLDASDLGLRTFFAMKSEV